MKSLKKAYLQPAIEEIKLDNQISLQLATDQSGTSPGDPFSAAPRSGAQRAPNSPESDPFEYETW